MVGAGDWAALDEVVRFANSLDVEQSADALATTTSAQEWLDENLDFRLRLSSVHLALLCDLRESIRTAMRCHGDGQPIPSTVFEQWSRLLRGASPSFEIGRGGVQFKATRPRNVSAVIIRLLAAIDLGLKTGSFSRVKLCHNDSCAWAFLDSSRSRTGRWCAMGVCGNRAKQAKWREGTRTGSPAAIRRK